MFGNSSGFLRSVKYRGQIWRELLVRTHEHKEAQRSSFDIQTGCLYPPETAPSYFSHTCSEEHTHTARNWKKKKKKKKKGQNTLAT